MLLTVQSNGMTVARTGFNFCCMYISNGITILRTCFGSTASVSLRQLTPLCPIVIIFLWVHELMVSDVCNNVSLCAAVTYLDFSFM